MKYIGASIAVLGICAMGAFYMHLAKGGVCFALPLAIFGCIIVTAIMCED